MSSVLITGANRGIGLALVKEFINHGDRVIATARQPDKADGLIALSETYHEPDYTIIPMDITNADSVNQAFAKIAQSFPSLDILVNNAGLNPDTKDERFEAMDLTHFEVAFEVNVVGTARATRVFLPLIRKSDEPRIINISSGAGSISEKVNFKLYSYSTSKAALNMFTRALAAELKPEEIVVAALSPGWVRTAMGGDDAEISPEESANCIVNTAHRLTMDDSSQFFGRDGNRENYHW